MHTSFTDSPVLGKFNGDTNSAQSDLHKLVAVSALIVKLERICSSGVLSEEDEKVTRELIVKAAKAFLFDTLAERPCADVIRVGDHDAEFRRNIEIVTREMGA